jgi:hypothetical protein
MKVLLAWLADFAWILYAACGLGALVYFVRALSLRRHLAVSLTAFEREVTVRQVARLWRVALTFAMVGVALFIGQAYLLPQVMPAEGELATPTLVGLVTPTPSPSPMATPVLGALPTVTVTVPPPLPPPPEEPSPTFEPTSAPEPTPTYLVAVRFGDVAELVGYDLSSTEINPDQTAGLTLYWQALEGAGAADYWVLVHLLSPDVSQLVGQHDGAPAGGARPTAGWMPGEIVVDYHEIALADPEYAGGIRVHVGLYNPVAPDVRVPVEGGGDYVALPVGITVVGP